FITASLACHPHRFNGDTGLALFLTGFDSWEAAARSPLAGALWETHVVTNEFILLERPIKRQPVP
ncbi:MAG: hypothetical protein WBV95_15980, partial [Desulfobacterales bacterium]